jgi:tRNA pseudouridine55 synthase
VKRSGILLVDKPAGITSHDAVARTRRAAGTRKVGHAGTLDPMATGLLVLGINASTRLLTYVVGLDKEYFATLRLGSATTTDDAEGDPTESASPASVAAITPDQVAAGLANLTGVVQQVPSSVSAIKVDGKRAYALVREGETVELAARTVTISAIEILASRRGDTFLDVDVRVECSSGTYIRAIARDLGAALGVGGHLTALRRTRIGPFEVVDAVTDLTPESVEAALVPPGVIAERLFPHWRLTAEEAIDVANGKRVPHGGPDSGPIAALAPDGSLVGLVQATAGVARSIVNFPPDPREDTE